MRSLILVALLVPLAACTASARNFDTPEPSGMHTYTLTSDVSVEDLLGNPFRSPRRRLEEGKTVRVCRPGPSGRPPDCRFFVPALGGRNVVTFYEPGGMRAFMERGTLHRATMDDYLNRNVSVQVCDMPLVTDSRQRPPCQRVHSLPT